MPRYSAPFKGCTRNHVSQWWNAVSHKALDIVNYTPQAGRATPLCAPEDVQIIRIVGETITHDKGALERGYGLYMRGLETGNVHMFWHSYPTFPVNVGEIVKRGKIVCFMSNSGTVYSGGVYVPVEDRLKTDKGTHLHWEGMKDWNGKKVELFDFSKDIDWNLQPTYTWMEHKLAILKTVLKAQQLLNNQ